MNRINETLTPEQRKSWSEMTGESYDFPADAYFDDGGDDRGAERSGVALCRVALARAAHPRSSGARLEPVLRPAGPARSGPWPE